MTETWSGYFTLYQNETKDGYWGAILVVDSKGCPQEFRATFPVKPTSVQRLLYGDSLDWYIGVELCGKPLLDSIQSEIDFLLVNKPYLLDIRESTSVPVAFIQKTGETIQITSSGSAEKSATHVDIQPICGKYQPVTINTALYHEDDLDRIQPIITDLFSGYDILEPFDRIGRALQTLISQDVRFK